MSTHPHRFLLAAFATLAIATTSIAFGPVAAASAATTNIALGSIPTTPVAGQPVMMQTYVIASDGTTPAGSVNVRVEGFSFIVGAAINTSTHEADVNIGNFTRGSIVVDATFTPTNPLYSSATTHTTVTIAGLDTLSLRPVFPDPLVVGTPFKVSVLMAVDSGTAFAPGGVVGFTANGGSTSVASCTPAATGAARNFSCSATVAAPTKPGTYTIKAYLGRSSYYNDTSGTATTTVKAKTAEKLPPKPAKKTVTAPTPGPTATTDPATVADTVPTAAPDATATAAPVKEDALASTPRVGNSITPDPWEWLFLAALILLIAAAVMIPVVLRRRRLVTPKS